MHNYVYMLQCADGTFYTGWTNHLQERINTHNEGRGAKYTKPRTRRPVRLVYAECFADKEAALRREYAIKQLSRKDKEELCAGWGEGDFRMGKLFYLMGKSASGKDSFYEQLIMDEALSLKPLVIYTTRPIRSGETDGVEYHFTDDEHLAVLQEAGKVIELREYDTIHGIWKYFTVDDEHIDLTKNSYLGIGTLVSYQKLLKYYGDESVIPLYIQVDDGIRLDRALKREHKQAEPKYEEMCRRFLADQKDFSENKLKKAGITRRFENNDDRNICLEMLKSAIREEKEGHRGETE